MPLHALKGHSGVPACGGGSLKDDAIPPPTSSHHHQSYEQPPHASLYRVHGGGGRGRDGEPTPQCPVRFTNRMRGTPEYDIIGGMLWMMWIRIKSRRINEKPHSMVVHSKSAF